MKIAFIITSLANKGPIIMVQSLVLKLVQKGFDCDVYYFDAITDLKFNCPVKQISFFEVIPFRNYDLIHSHLFRSDVYCAIHHQKIQKAGAKLISTIHTAIYDDLAFTYGKLVSILLIPVWKLAWQKMDHVILLTKAAQRYYQNTEFKALSIINNGRDVSLTGEGISDTDLNEILALKKKYTLLGTVCNIDSRKGLEQILELLTINNNYAFIVIGDGPEHRTLAAIARQYRVSSRFKVMGFRAEGYRYIKHFDIYVLPSRSEGMPLALLETMALKVPAVCTRIPSLAAEFSDDVCYFFNLDDVTDLSRACELATNDLGLKTLAAFETYNNKYTSEKMVKNYVELYEILVETL
ncbi:glycosyltransferase [Pedobacter kyonggii]|uniref:Glycosyltransferase n=1 Tax=Pedobacter kyonggii TaxID=1926871 RepID=A0A4Q9HF09_9SPHI|nr:glycosyltransferase [Pedobacter kyonggii]TBO43317.1 glycosyltransferase [Pedobacter kyonggii]